MDPNQPMSFDPLQHVPPKYDIYGNLKKQHIIPGQDTRNILKDKERIKIPWEGYRPEGQVASRTELNARRKKDRIPDITYDLDCDGYVGGRDYVISKRFDVDKDGKLNDLEKRNALQAIKNNIEDEYIWNLENLANKPTNKTSAGKNGENNTENKMRHDYLQPFRILQKRGKIIQAENFLPIRDTYPKHPNYDYIPDTKTLTELKQKRVKETKDVIDDKIRLWDEHNPNQIIKEPSEIKKNMPKYTSMNQIKNEKNRLARLDHGLNELTSDIKDVYHDPGLNYMYNPDNKIKEDLKNKARKENQELSKLILARNHINEIERLNMREDEIFDMGYFVDNRKTYSKIKEGKRKENVDYNMKTFSKQTIGVHGHELPKFSEDEQYKEFWKFREGWIEHPKYMSQAEFLEHQKFWKKAEELKINEHKEVCDLNDFKKVYITKEKKDGFITKINKLNHFKGFDPDNPVPIDIDEVKRNHIYRWTTLVNQFSNQKFKKGRYFDNLPSMKDSIEDDKGLFSSFAENGIFESKYGKE